MSEASVRERASEIFHSRLHRIQSKTDHVFAVLLVVQWLFALLLALIVSPQTWVVDQPYWHVHLWATLLLGGALTIGPVGLVWFRPGRFSTRLVVALAQVSYSTLLIHLTGGRIETHFHIFGSLAFLSFYRDWRIFIPATLLVAADHMLRGIFWPESVFGVLTAAPWRAFEHAGWVLFEDIFLIWGCLTSRSELRETAFAQAETEDAKQNIEDEVQQRTSELAARTADLTAERQLLEAVLNSVTDGIVATDDEGNVLCFNKGAEAIFSAESLKNPNPFEWAKHYQLYKPDSDKPLPTYDMPLCQAIRGQTVSNELLKVCGAETEQLVSVNAAPLASDLYCGAIASFRDVTEHTQLQTQLSEAQKLESIGQLAAGVAHEINTPMQYVQDNVEFLSESAEKLFEVVDAYRTNLHDTQSPKTWQQRIEHLEEIQQRARFENIRKQVPLAIDETREGVKRVIEIVRAMKQLSHPGGQEKVSTDINEAVRSTVTVSRNRWKYAADMSLELCDSLPDVKTLTAELNQVLINLVVNAADAIVDRYGEEGQMGQITVRTHADQQYTYIEVQDNGCGMPEEVKRKTFEPFFTTKDVGKGTGQGLALCYNVVVKHHSGILEVDSVPGEGTTFVVGLPLAATTDEQDASDNQHETLA